MMACVMFVASLFVTVAALADTASVNIAPGSATAEAFRALDTDKSGKVERNEVEAFAKNQGLSAEDARAEFAELDKNGDGQLDEEELSQTLNELPAAGAAATPPAVVASSAAPPSVTAPQSAEAQAVSTASPVVASPAAYSPATPVKYIAAAAPLSADGTLESQALELEAQQHAGKALAEVFARPVAKALETRSQDTAKAAKLDETAKALRGKADLLKRTAAEQTVKAAANAAEVVLREASVKVDMLGQKAAVLEQQAAEKRKQAKEAIAKALQAQADMTRSVEGLKQ